MNVTKKSIASTAMAFEALDSILENVKTNKDVKEDLKANPMKKASLEIKHVDVPDTLIESITAFARKEPLSQITEEVEVEQEEVETLNEEVVVQKAQTLVKKLSELLQEAKVVIEEMTTCGMIGTNQKFTLKPKKKGLKNGPLKVNQGNKSFGRKGL